MPQVERVYTIPLRREYLKAPRHKRAQRAMSALRAFLQRHMKSETILLDQLVNEYVWQHGMKNPPHHIRVKAVKNDDGTVHVTLEEETLKGKPVKKAMKKEEKKSAKKTREKKETEKEPKEEKKKEKKESENMKKQEEKRERKTPAEGKKTKQSSKKETGKKKTASKKTRVEASDQKA